MDLHHTDDQPPESEKKAIDVVLAPPNSGWDGSTRDVDLDRHVAARVFPRRDLLLPVLHSIQSRIGWISPGAINYIAVRMNLPPAEIYGVASFYSMFSLLPRPLVVAHVCDDIACLTHGAAQLCSTLENTLGKAGSASADGKMTWVRSPCLGLCERAPAALVSAAGEAPKERVLAPALADSVLEIMKDLSQGKRSAEPDTASEKPEIPQAGSLTLRLLQRVGQIDPTSFEEYRGAGGYTALTRAIAMGPEAVVREVIESRLLGRGGAAFPAGKKWEAVRRQCDRRPHYVVCNADESEPGTFKDRILMEGDPFAVLEGMTIAAFGACAEKGYIYIRGEYPIAAERLSHAIESVRNHGMLGKNILGSEFCFDVELRRGAGAYICGEETALFNSIEGYRGEPRNKPPFPTEAGLFRKPTVVNNVETLVNILEIMLKGGAAYAKIGTANSCGHRLFCVSGHAVHPGVYEFPFGVSLRYAIEAAGGVGGTGKLQAVLLGGAAGSFLSPNELDTPLTFEDTRAIGATLGSGVIMLFDDSVDLRQILLRIAEFFREETCGQCVPCRVGVTRQKETLERMIEGKPSGRGGQEIRLLQEMAQAMRDASICGLGQTASSAILSAVERWSFF
ncbi:MAG TPA: NAD(P)H-dependent oxidoreductase subunit E [Terriglobales bacterium]|nr:NAD(P)H-dependent oxidoreductase subunit E [Terriglobales bacterium]